MSELKVISMGGKLPIAQSVVHNGLAYISGHVGFKPGTSEPIAPDIRSQAKETFRRLDEALKNAGSSVDKIVFCRVSLKNVQRDFAAMNEVFVEWVGDHRPARTTVGSDLAVEGLLIEIDLIAAVD